MYYFYNINTDVHTIIHFAFTIVNYMNWFVQKKNYMRARDVQYYKWIHKILIFWIGVDPKANTLLIVFVIFKNKINFREEAGGWQMKFGNAKRVTDVTGNASRNFFKSPKVSHFCHSLLLLSWAEINFTIFGQPLVSSIGKTSKVSPFLSFQFTNTFLLQTICILRVVPKKVRHNCSLSFLPYDMFGFWFLPISCFLEILNIFSYLIGVLLSWVWNRLWRLLLIWNYNWKDWSVNFPIVFVSKKRRWRSTQFLK